MAKRKRTPNTELKIAAIVALIALLQQVAVKIIERLF
jgi:hypothetical protein